MPTKGANKTQIQLRRALIYNESIKEGYHYLFYCAFNKSNVLGNQRDVRRIVLKGKQSSDSYRLNIIFN